MLVVRFAPVIGSFVAFFLALTPAARAGDIPPCWDHVLGATVCYAGRMCECIFEQGGLITGKPATYRWDCSILRSACGPALDRPVTVQENRGTAARYPTAVSIDRSSSDVSVETETTGGLAATDADATAGAEVGSAPPAEPGD